MKKSILMILIPLVAVVVVFLVFHRSRGGDVNEMVAKVNSRCPVNNDEYITLESVIYDDKANEVVYNLAIHEKIVGKEYLVNAVNWLKSYDWPEMLTEEGELRDIIKALSARNGAVRFRYTGDVSGVSVSICLTPEEVVELRESPASEAQRVERSANFVNVFCNAQLPAEVIPGISVVRGFDDGENMLFTCKVDETVHDMDSIAHNIMHMKEVLRRELLSNKAGAYLHDIGHGIGCRYRGVPSDRAVEFTILPSELDDI